MNKDLERAREGIQQALDALGYRDDPELQGSAARIVEWLNECSPRSDLPELSLFPAPGHDPVMLRDLPFHSVCAHHLLPFFGRATVAYVPGERIFGLGSVPRLLRHLSRQPQLQERLGAQLAEALLQLGGARAVAVRLSARQMCMEMRGTESPGEVVTFAFRGQHVPELQALVTHG